MLAWLTDCPGSCPSHSDMCAPSCQQLDTKVSSFFFQIKGEREPRWPAPKVGTPSFLSMPRPVGWSDAKRPQQQAGSFLVRLCVSHLHVTETKKPEELHKCLAAVEVSRAGLVPTRRSAWADAKLVSFFFFFLRPNEYNSNNTVSTMRLYRPFRSSVHPHRIGGLFGWIPRIPPPPRSPY